MSRLSLNDGACGVEKRFVRRLTADSSEAACKIEIFGIYLQSKSNGALSEWSGTGLQNQVQQFDSARHLSIYPLGIAERVFVLSQWK